jgi:hypothetical protein
MRRITKARWLTRRRVEMITIKTLAIAALSIAMLMSAKAETRMVGFTGIVVACETFESAERVAGAWEIARFPAYAYREIAYKARCQDSPPETGTNDDWYILVRRDDSGSSQYARVCVRSPAWTGTNCVWFVTSKNAIVEKVN